MTVFPSAVPSFDLYVNESDIVSEPSCTYSNVPLELRVNEPYKGLVTIIAFKSSPSISLSFKSNVDEPKPVLLTVADS